ncbi:MAG: DegV family protein [Lachnospira sp.]
MGKILITTDTTSDLPIDFVKENNIDIVNLFYAFGDTVYGKENVISEHEFYDKMRNGAMPTTMACNPEDCKDMFARRIEEGYDIIHIAFSSALSSSCNNAKIAADEIKEDNPSAKIEVIDSLSASMGEGLAVYKAVQLRNEGKSFEEIVDWLNENILHIVHNFTVDDLNHLYRGGRVSKATAIIGTLAGIKPVLHVSDEGKLVAIGKVRGRKKSLIQLVDRMESNMGAYRDKNDVVFIVHGDCPEDAQFVADKVRERFGIDNIWINYVCPTIGAHSGPGTVALFFLGDKR